MSAPTHKMNYTSFFLKVKEAFPEYFVWDKGISAGVCVGWESTVGSLFRALHQTLDNEKQLREKFGLGEPHPRIVVTQIKEKFGDFVFYWDLDPIEIFNPPDVLPLETFVSEILDTFREHVRKVCSYCGSYDGVERSEKSYYYLCRTCRPPFSLPYCRTGTLEERQDLLRYLDRYTSVNSSQLAVAVGGTVPRPKWDYLGWLLAQNKLEYSHSKYLVEGIKYQNIYKVNK